MTIIRPCLRIAAVALVLSLAPGLGPVSSAVAQPQPELVLGTVDFDRIIKESKAGKAIKSQYDKQKSAFKANLDQKRKAFGDQAQKLNAQKGTLSDNDFKTKVAELNAKGKAIEDSLAQSNQALDTNFTKAVGQIRSALLEITADIAKKRALTLVINMNDVILAADAYDFSDEAMKTLDATLPSVKLTGSN
jgi:outer membrane protein